MNKPIEYSYCVNESIFAGEHPLYSRHTVSPNDRIAQFVQFGITDFLDLTVLGEAQEYKQILPQGVRKYSFPIRNFEAPDSVQSLIEVFEKIKLLFTERPGIKLYIHCHGGVGRTGTVVACYYIYSEHLSFDEAIAKMRKQYTQSPRSKMMNVPETSQQMNFIFKFADVVRCKQS